MKSFLTFLSLVMISTICQAQVGIELNGTFYADGSTAVLPCGVQNVYARVRDGSVYRFCLNQNAIIIQPAGWTHGSDGSDNCPSFQTTATTGGTLKLEYATGFTGQTFTVQINIERPVPANLVITGPDVICSGSTQTLP